MKYLLILLLLVLVFGIGCYGGGSYQAGTHKNPNEYRAVPVYNTRTGETEWINPMPFTVREGHRPTYTNFDTGEVYLPLQGPGNFYMGSDGNTIQPY